MRKLLVLLALCVLGGAIFCRKAKEEKIVVIIQDETSKDTTAQHAVDTIVDTVVVVDTVSVPDTLLKREGGVRTMSLTGAVVLLEHDLSRGDAKRLLRHIEALGNAVAAELEEIEAASGDEEGDKEAEKVAAERKRTLNVFMMKLWSLKRAVKDFEKKGIPREEIENIKPTIDELGSLARRIEGKRN